MNFPFYSLIICTNEMETLVTSYEVPFTPYLIKSLFNSLIQAVRQINASVYFQALDPKNHF